MSTGVPKFDSAEVEEGALQMVALELVTQLGATDEATRALAHEIWRDRDARNLPGTPLDDWVKAEHAIAKVVPKEASVQHYHNLRTTPGLAGGSALDDRRAQEIVPKEDDWEIAYVPAEMCPADCQ